MAELRGEHFENSRGLDEEEWAKVKSADVHSLCAAGELPHLIDFRTS